jgi:hypothetical protein
MSPRRLLLIGFAVALVMNPISLIHSTMQRGWAVLIIPVKVNIDSGGKPNGVPERR